MILKCYPLLSTCSRRAISRSHWRGRTYLYRPKGNLLKRLSKILNLSIDEVYMQLIEERQYLLKISKS